MVLDLNQFCIKSHVRVGKNQLGILNQASCLLGRRYDLLLEIGYTLCLNEGFIVSQAAESFRDPGPRKRLFGIAETTALQT